MNRIIAAHAKTNNVRGIVAIFFFIMAIEAPIFGQFEKGDWLLNSKFYYIDAASKIDFQEKKTDNHFAFNWQFTIGNFISDRFFLGFKGLLENEKKEIIQLDDFGINQIKIIEGNATGTPMLRWYFKKNQQHFRWFLHGECQVSNRKMQIFQTQWQEEYRDWFRLFGNAGVGFSFFKARNLNFEILWQYQFYENKSQRPTWVERRTAGPVSLSLNLFAHISKSKLNNSKHYYPNNFVAGTIMGQFSSELFPWLGNKEQAFAEIGIGYFLFKKWAIGASIPIQFYVGNKFEPKLFTRFYQSILPQIQIFPQISLMYLHGNRFYGFSRWARNETENAFAFFYGLGMNVMLNETIGIEWVAGRVHRAESKTFQTASGILIESKINYFLNL